MAAGTSGAPSVETSGPRAVLPPLSTVELGGAAIQRRPRKAFACASSGRVVSALLDSATSFSK